MKLNLPLLVAAIFCVTGSLFAQVPQSMNYQTIVRDAGGNILANHNVSFRFTIQDGINPGTPEYQETQTGSTNRFGLVTRLIGQGTVVNGTFSAINWATGNKYLLVELDANGGTNYVSMGTAELVSVPYAFYAAAAGNGGGATGPTGTAGLPGNDGATGPTGLNGIAGVTGAAGALGATGLQGNTGVTGADGATGLTGLQGTTGAVGDAGPTGLPGVTGADGTTGLTGLQGATGAAGDAGPTGLAGVTGADGATGLTGLQGITGAAGATGLMGVAGPTGLGGAIGATGLQGSTGVTGPSGSGSGLGSGTAAGNTTYWNGAQWVLNSSNIYNNGGNVGIGTATPAYQLDVAGAIENIYLTPGVSAYNTGNAIFENTNTNYARIALVNGAGNSGVMLIGNTSSQMNVGTFNGGYAQVNASAFNVSSDITLKKDVTYLSEADFNACMEQIRNIQSIRFRYKTESAVKTDGMQYRPQLHLGVVAQSLPTEVVANVDLKADGNQTAPKLGLSLADMSGLLVAGVKALDNRQTQTDLKQAELYKLIAAQQQQIEELKKQNEQMLLVIELLKKK